MKEKDPISLEARLMLIFLLIFSIACGVFWNILNRNSEQLEALNKEVSKINHKVIMVDGRVLEMKTALFEEGLEIIIE